MAWAVHTGGAHAVILSCTEYREKNRNDHHGLGDPQLHPNSEDILCLHILL